jgi:hypothetical protein
MNQRKGSRRRLVVFFASTILVSMTLAVVALSNRKQETKAQKSGPVTFKAESVDSVPQVSSKVKNLEIASVRITKQGTAQAALAIDIVNNTDQPVMSLELTSGDDYDFSSLGLDGIANPDEPKVQIPPRSLKTVEWPLSAILKGYPIRISAAIFADGKEAGEASSIEAMRNDHVRAKSRREALKKGVPQ